LSDRLLAGRHVIVTGAASGIGAATALGFDKAGASVTMLDVNAGDGIIACDVTDENMVESVFAGATPFTDVVHAAGTVSTGAVTELTLAEFREVIDVNLIGSFLVARAASRRIADGGAITLLASQGGRRGGAHWSAYCASKFGVIGLAQSLAQELAARRVRVNAVCPGTIDTPMTDEAIGKLAQNTHATIDHVRQNYEAKIPFGRFGTPDEVANVCVFLASELASYISGSSIVVDGAELS
jgi:NAD(P)-dependent dehydrogenase (short-subunit alcohol dehydrogenase family)